MTEDYGACTTSSVCKFESAINELITETLKEAVILVENNIPGALLDGGIVW